MIELLAGIMGRYDLLAHLSSPCCQPGAGAAAPNGSLSTSIEIGL